MNGHDDALLTYVSLRALVLFIRRLSMLIGIVRTERGDVFHKSVAQVSA